MTGMLTLGFMFAILFLTLGPLKLIPTFSAVTVGMDGRRKTSLAIRSTLLALVILLAATLVGSAMATNWHVSREALTVTCGFLLLFGSLKTLAHVLSPVAHEPAPSGSEPATRPISIIVSPLAIPGIITPWGLVALLLFVSIAEDHHQLGGILIVLLLNMALNVICMLIAAPIMRTVGLPAMSVLGWVFSILQAALGVTFLLRGLVAVFGLPWAPTPL
jgi:multiple antibiotic resistance protein